MAQYTRLEATFLTETAKAVLVDVEGEELWIPESQIGEDSQIYVGCRLPRGDVAELQVSTWLARKRGLVD